MSIENELEKEITCFLNNLTTWRNYNFITTEQILRSILINSGQKLKMLRRNQPHSLDVLPLF